MALFVGVVAVALAQVLVKNESTTRTILTTRSEARRTESVPVIDYRVYYITVERFVTITTMATDRDGGWKEEEVVIVVSYLVLTTEHL